MNDTKRQEVKKITVRSASIFGLQLANNVAERLEKDQVPPSRWPAKFPITLKQITSTPEVGGNSKIAKKISEAARTIWKDMRERALEIEKDMLLHPEFYFDEEDKPKKEDTVWRYLSIELEQIAGKVFLTDLGSEDEAKTYIYKFLSPLNLKKCMVEFDDDYKNFTNEIREAIRIKKSILPSIRLELICLINTNTKAADKLISSARKRR